MLRNSPLAFNFDLGESAIEIGSREIGVALGKDVEAGRHDGQGDGNRTRGSQCHENGNRFRRHEAARFPEAPHVVTLRER